MYVVVVMKDGREHKFPDAYGVKYEGVFVIVRQENNRTSYPAADVKEVRESPYGGY